MDYKTGDRVLLLKDEGTLPAVVIDVESDDGIWYVILGADNEQYTVRRFRLAMVKEAEDNDGQPV